MTDSVKVETPNSEITIPESAEIVKEKVAKLSVVPQWRKIFLTWSFWFHTASVILTLIEQILPFFSLLEPTMTGTAYGAWMFGLNVAGILSKFIKQKNLWQYTIEEKKDV